ncbi:ABC transporter permease [Legionella erythra]|uniref:FtsX-like permease family protein n=1 Tax=Legionella erythra TaxID=448 RepID=A0A0W0TSS5_LEGER|nr:FtsX-like permease family protein [Legionella erythra]KTC98572.1 FtsX-like permease family protein [Legionella erythra]
MLKLPLAIKALVRDWRSGELTLLFMALVIAVACVSALNHFTYAVNLQLQQGAASLLGADAVVTSQAPIDPLWIKEANTRNLTQTVNLTFLSMAEHEEQLQLAQITAISPLYPLRGSLKIAFRIDDAEGHAAHAPPPGEVWLSPRLLPLLNLTLGETIHIGAASFRLTGIIRQEPGQMGDWFSFSPRILMNQADLYKTQVIKPGSNLLYSWLLKGNPDSLAQLHGYLQKQLTDQQQWLDSQSSTPTVSRTIDRTLNYLHLGTLMSLVLAGVAISMASLRYCQRQLKQVALLRCFGASEKQVITVYFTGLSLLGFLASLTGGLIGYALQPVLVQWLGGLLPDIKPQIHAMPFVFSLVSGMLLLFCFSLGNIWALRQVTAIAIFREQHHIGQNSAYLTYGLALLLLALLAYLYTQSFSITAAVLIGCVAYVGVVIASLWLIFSLVKGQRTIPLNWRFGLNNIARNLEDSALQVVGIGLALTAILSLFLLKHDLLANWRQQLPANTANYFLINVEPSQLPDLRLLLQQEGVEAADFYPVVRGRLIAINRQPVKQVFGEDTKNINALQRELNLSWTRQLPDGNEITAGRWASNPDKPWVSVELGLANRLGLKTGDHLTFQISDNQLEVEIRSLRKVDWTTFKPNFFMLFKPDLLKEFPHTLITSLYVSPEQQSALIKLVRQFPNVSLIDIANTLNRIQAIITSAGNAITLITFFALLAGLVVAALAILSFSGSKQQETHILKMLGMSRYALLWIRSSEAWIIGAYAGFLASVAAIAINGYLASTLLDIPFSIPWTMVLCVPLATATVTVILNIAVQRTQYNRSTRLHTMS